VVINKQSLAWVRVSGWTRDSVTIGYSVDMECKVWIMLGGDHGVDIIWRSPRPGVKKHGIDFSVVKEKTNVTSNHVVYIHTNYLVVAWTCWICSC
jgi:hypothetical protein